MPPTVNLIVSALVRRDGRLLLVEEQGPEDPASCWMLPGGRVEPGETLLTALDRELMEETGLRRVGSPGIAFAVEITAPEGAYSAFTFHCAAEGSVTPDDPDGLVLRADWVAADEALARLGRVAWYDATFLARYISGEAQPGATYTVVRP